jgi:hypothetical protein
MFELVFLETGQIASTISDGELESMNARMNINWEKIIGVGITDVG